MAVMERVGGERAGEEGYILLYTTNVSSMHAHSYSTAIFLLESYDRCPQNVTCKRQHTVNCGTCHYHNHIHGSPVPRCWSANT